MSVNTILTINHEKYNFFVKQSDEIYAFKNYYFVIVENKNKLRFNRFIDLDGNDNSNVKISSDKKDTFYFSSIPDVLKAIALYLEKNRTYTSEEKLEIIKKKWKEFKIHHSKYAVMIPEVFNELEDIINE